jgi:ribulose-phosphate 3-epimerase
MRLAVPAILPSSQQDLQAKLSLFTEIPSLEHIQIDVVDGKFAEPACWPYTAPLEMHARVEKGEMLPHPDRIAYEIDLMCIDPEKAAAEWLALGASRLTFHAETTTDLPRLLSFAKAQYGSGGDFATGLVAFGIALNLGSDLDLIESSLGEVAYVQFMGIAHIGRQGQPLDERVFEKIRIFRERHPDISVQVDGGVTLESAKKLLALGVSSLVVGSAIAHADNPAHALQAFEDLKNSYGV